MANSEGIRRPTRTLVIGSPAAIPINPRTRELATSAALPASARNRTSERFREYLREVPDELLESVSQDYVWLSTLGFESAIAAEFRMRRDCCRDECLRRGSLNLFQDAESAILQRTS
jgi:hypothetical protein